MPIDSNGNRLGLWENLLPDAYVVPAENHSNVLIGEAAFREHIDEVRPMLGHGFGFYSRIFLG